jgi:plastocyanin
MMRPFAICAAVLAVTACSTTDSGPAPTERVVHLICATGDADAPCAFEPAELTVPVGTTVRWVVDDDTYHTVTSSSNLQVRRPSGRFDAVLDSTGDEFTYTFGEPGTYPYYCRPHAEFMAGSGRRGGVTCRSGGGNG